MRRTGPFDKYDEYSAMEIRLYQVPNLMQKLPVTVTGSPPYKSYTDAGDLKNELERRTSGNNLKPLTDLYGNRSTDTDWFKTSES